jgi:dolichyl-phosphate beta-glucosyltransferase
LYLSLVIPAFREATRIAPTLAKVYEYLSNASYQSEVIVVDDGSPDDTVAVVQREIATLPSSDNVVFRLCELGHNQGKGAAVQAGMLAAIGDIRIFTDADLSTPVHEVEKVFKAIEKEGYDVVIGSRALEGRALVKVHQPWYREMMGRFFNLLVQLFVFRGVKDTQCGFKGFTAAAATKLFNEQKVMGFSFDVDILYLAKRNGFKLKEVAVEWYNDERTTVGALSDSSRMFFEILRIRRLHK